MNIAVISEKCGFFGGLEKYVFDTTKLLNKQFNCFAIFNEDANKKRQYSSVFIQAITTTDSDKALLFLSKNHIDIVMIHKIDSHLLSEISGIHKTIAVIHDHDYYCFRHHKYFPFSRKNCCYKQSLLRCSVCSMLLEKRGDKLELINPFNKLDRLNHIRKSDALIVLSNYMKENLTLNDVEESKIFTVHPFVESLNKNKCFSNKNRQLKLLFCSQMIRGKGLAELLSILTLVNIDYKLTILGTGNDTDRCKALAKKLNVTDKITFEGFTPEIEKYYSESDIVVFPSTWQEPFGLVGVEAFAHSKPVVAFDGGGVSEWLKNEYNGYLIQNGDYEGFAAALEDLHNDRPRLKQFSNNAYTSSLAYNKDMYVENMSRIFNTVSEQG